MRAFRSLRRFGAALGLFALLLQLAMSFGHVHPDDLFASASGASGQVADQVQAGGGGADRHAPGAPHDDCPICAAMHLAGTIVMPEAPVLAVPTRFTAAHFATADLAQLFVPGRLPFQTRAPPTA